MLQNQSNSEEKIAVEAYSRDEALGGKQISVNEFDGDKWIGGKRCPFSDPAHPHYLHRVRGCKTKQKCCSCEGFNSPGPGSRKKYHYCCAICKVEFHRWCRKLPSKIIHPYHPEHPLTFTFLRRKKEMIVDTNYSEYEKYSLSLQFYKTFETLSGSSLMFDKCTWCASDLGQWFYRCLICNFSLDLHCISKNPRLTIQNPKSHHHSLSLFPQPASFPCRACGLIDAREPSYACYQCNYVVHRYCVGLPRIIKITRHPHRLSLTPYLPTKVSTCRVCYKNVDIKYGQYSCNDGDCSYVIHSRCGTHRQVWDGEELEWEPEESNKAEDIVAPYKKLEGGLIEHFSHHHHFLKLRKYDDSRDSGKQCHACMRSILSSPDDFYDCIKCEFFLHELCANLPRKLDHGLHFHSLFLEPDPLLNDQLTYCDVCEQNLSCWKYICKRKGCIEETFLIDVNCILVPECFTHGSHAEHLMFMCTTYEIKDHIICQGCRKQFSGHRLKCTKCDFVLCYDCATIPEKVHYKYDEHPLSICYGESGTVDGMYWCEVCEKKLDPKEWFYNNNDCATIHVKCVLGDSAFVKSGQSFDYVELKVEVVSNSSSRPTCSNCQRRCPHTVYIKAYETGGSVKYDFCSFVCIDKFIN